MRPVTESKQILNMTLPNILKITLPYAQVVGGGGSGLVCTVSAFISNNVSAQKKVARAENNTFSGRNPEN